MKKRNIEETASLKVDYARSVKKNSPRMKFIKMAAMYFFAFIYGYVYNFFLAPYTFYVRFKYRNNFLNIDKNEFDIISIEC